MVREATSADIPAIVDLISTSLEDGPYAGKMKDNRARTAVLASQILDSLGKILLWQEDGVTTGLLSFTVMPHYTTGEIVADELAWYVLPDHRAGGSALRLFWRAEEIAREMGATCMKYSAPNEAIASLYERFGYRKLETVHVKEFSPCHS